jgi:hypothetical protein
MKKIIIFILFIISTNALAQTTLTTSAGISFHGSGDLGGYGVSFGIEKPLKNRLLLTINTRFTTHSGQRELYYEEYGELYNSSYRQVTAGTQIEILPTFVVAKSKFFNLRLHAGVVGRYQVSNNYTDVMFLYTPVTNFPIPLISLDIGDNDRFKQLSVGYLAQVSTQFRISEKSKLGLSLIMQNDNEGDLIWNMPISYYFTF